ncbi:claudin-20-like [Stigmatopora argus]
MTARRSVRGWAERGRTLSARRRGRRHFAGTKTPAPAAGSCGKVPGGIGRRPPLTFRPAVAVASGGAQILALVLALLGTAGAALATLLPSWQVGTGARSGALLPVWRTRGLWMDCLWYGAGGFSCGWRESPPYARAAMILSCAAGASGLCLTSLGLRCTRWGGPARSKGRAAAAAGACFAAAGALCLPPAFLLAREPPVAEYRPGGALCLASVSAAFLLAAGVVFCLPTDAGPGSARPGPSSAETGSSSARPGPPAEASPETAGALGKKGPVVDEERSENVKDSYVMQEYV